MECEELAGGGMATFSPMTEANSAMMGWASAAAVRTMAKVRWSL